MGYEEFYLEAIHPRKGNPIFCVVSGRSAGSAEDEVGRPDLLHDCSRDTLENLNTFSKDCVSEVRWQWGGSDEEKEIGSSDFAYQMISQLNPIWGLKVGISWVRDEPSNRAGLAMAAALKHVEMWKNCELPNTKTPQILWSEVK